MFFYFSHIKGHFRDLDRQTVLLIFSAGLGLYETTANKFKTVGKQTEFPPA